MSLTRIMAGFVRGLGAQTLPPEVIEKAKACLLNGYGIGLGCHTTPYAPVARQAALAMNGQWTAGGATLLGDGRRTSVAGAALANSALFHGRAQEDTCGAAHLGAIMIPLLTAMIEADGYPMDRLIPAVVAGYEIGGVLEQAGAGYSTPAGFRSSTVYGTVAAAAAAARLMELSAEQTAAAIANAASFSGGLLQSFSDGTDEWRYQVGAVAQTGYTAAHLAKAGSISAPNAFEGPAGFFKAFTRTECDVDAIVGKLGRQWSTARVTFKPFPVCAFNQTPVLAALEVRGKLPAGNVEQVERIAVHMNPYETGYAGMDARGPFNSISGTLMSIPFCIANTLLYGVPDMHRMTSYHDANVAQLMERIDLVPDTTVNKLCCTIRVTLRGDKPLVHDQIMTFADYSYDRQGVSELIRRVGKETGIADTLYDSLETFVDAPERHSISTVIHCFSRLPGVSDNRQAFRHHA